MLSLPTAIIGFPPNVRPVASGDDDPVWYAAYGSNCDLDRFLTYLVGGPIPGTDDRQEGVRDPSAPQGDGPCRFDGQVVFTGHSPRWGGGYAFLGHDAVASGALGRRHLITVGQLADVLEQENGRSPTADSPGLGDRRERIAEAVASPTPGALTTVGPGAYDAIAALEPVDGVPVFTITRPSRPELLSSSAPSARYLSAIVGGLGEVHEIGPRAIAEVLMAAPGMAPVWTVETVAALAP